jgi:hypothetical protein
LLVVWAHHLAPFRPARTFPIPHLALPRVFAALERPGGISEGAPEWQRDPGLFRRWAHGTTGLPFVDAAMRELAATGFTSNRARQNVSSFLAKASVFVVVVWGCVGGGGGARGRGTLPEGGDPTAGRAGRLGACVCAACRSQFNQPCPPVLGRQRGPRLAWDCAV